MSHEPITCHCPKCGKGFRVPAELQGKKIVCKSCQTHFAVHGAPGPGGSHAAKAPAAAAPAPAKRAPAAAPPVAAASPAVASIAPPPVDDLAPIPIDDVPISLVGTDTGHSHSLGGREIKTEKIKIQATGPYYVIKLYLTGKSKIEETLNEHAADGWLLKQIITPAGGDAYAILYRDPTHQLHKDDETPPAPESSEETDIVPPK